MNTQAAQHDSSETRSDQNPVCPCHDMTDCPEQATIEINAIQLARIAELLDILDGFLRHTGVANRLAGYLHAAGRDHPQPPHGTSYDANLLIPSLIRASTRSGGGVIQRGA